jgi:hypothetical protein
MATIYCKSLGVGQVGFYLRERGKEHFLCSQRYYASMWSYFSGGVNVNSLFKKSGKHSHAVREAKRKLPAYVQYIEREEGICVLNKTIAKRNGQAERAKYQKGQVSDYNWHSDCLDAIV